MDNRCPKCNRKLSFWYIKQNCPDCGCDLLYYDMDRRLEEDAKKAEAEFETLNKILGKITPGSRKKNK